MNTDILSNLAIQKVCLATTIYNQTNARAKRADRPRWAVIMKYEGETVYRCNGKSYVSNADNMVILPMGCSYEWTCTKAGHYAVAEFQSDLRCDCIFRFPVKNGDKILRILKDLEYKRSLKKPMYEIESIRDVYTVILMLTEAKQKKYVPTEKAQKLAPAVEYIAKNFNKDLRNDDLARLTRISTVYFRKLFAEVYGISPMNYVKELRIKKAKEMLKSDYGSITDIALSLGYSTIYDFSRDFKKHTGVSPSKYG